MSDPFPPADDLAALRRRWELRATPQLSLQLAEEYRRSGDPAAAAAVLEKAVADNPSHLSVHVALGRLRLERGELEGAARALERVVERDPTHLVANKLLVRVYAGQGQPSRARDRLDLYRLLNESDPDVEELEALLPPADAGVVEASEEGFELAPAEPEQAAEEAVETTPARAEIVWDEEPLLPRSADLFAGPEGAGGDPFPGLWDDLDREGYQRRMDREGIFGGGEAPHREPEPEPESDAEAPPDASADATPEELAEREVSLDPDLEREPEPGGEPETARPAASMTLAALYRQQGHLEEARRAYREVLERQPGNREALVALADLSRDAEGRLTAYDLLGDELPGRPVARKIRVLEGYLGRLRGEGRAGV
ncbi:MAG: tetratricopeptide repeat protein [Thermoanaerobaculia bacterium]|nr:tetratricopeptide repeat protein [Thermoanaerobaculia bacterium]